MVPGDENPTALERVFDEAIAETRQALLSPSAIRRLLREPHVAERFNAFVQRTSEGGAEPVVARDVLSWDAVLNAVWNSAETSSDVSKLTVVESIKVSNTLRARGTIPPLTSSLFFRCLEYAGGTRDRPGCPAPRYGEQAVATQSSSGATYRGAQSVPCGRAGFTCGGSHTRATGANRGPRAGPAAAAAAATR